MDLPNFSQIPTTINTVEKLAAWAGLLLHRGNSTLKVLEAPNYTDFACQSSVFTAEDGTERLVIRLCLELESDYSSDGGKLWTNVKEFSEQAIPTQFRS